MLARDRPHQGKPQPDTAIALARSLDAEERLENPFSLRLRYASSAITDSELDVPRIWQRQRDLDGRARAMAVRIFQQVTHQAPDETWITRDFRSVTVEPGINAGTLFGDERSEVEAFEGRFVVRGSGLSSRVASIPQTASFARGLDGWWIMYEEAVADRASVLIGRDKANALPCLPSHD